MRFLVKQEKGSTRAVAHLLGVTQRTVERYLKGQLKRPAPDLAARLEAEVRKRWQPRVAHGRRQQAATTGGIVIETRARFGYTAAPGSTDDGRMRRITQSLPPAYAARLFDAQARRRHRTATPAHRRRRPPGDLLQGPRPPRATTSMVEFTDIDYVELDY